MITDEISIPTTEIEADGFITPQSALEYKNRAVPTSTSAKPISECIYPKCEDCDKYHGHYCTVPMVVSKQIYRETMERIGKLEKTLAELEKTVIDEILGAKGNINHDGYHKQIVCCEEVWCPDGCHIEVHDGLKYIVGDAE